MKNERNIFLKYISKVKKKLKGLNLVYQNSIDYQGGT